MLALVDFSFEFAGRYLYRNANWHIKPNEKIGLVGLNGTGKSTLLRVISGDFDLREGKMSRSGDLKIGFLNQDLLSLDIGESVRDVVLGGREDLTKLDKEIHHLLEKIETEYDDKTLQRLSDCQEQFGALGGYDWHAQADKILEGLGFTTVQLGKSLREFSGGWRMRAMLAKLLLQAPDLLLLDEPTNHLDLPTIEWLEDYLSDYQGTYVIVSHDRFFLDKTVNIYRLQDVNGTRQSYTTFTTTIESCIQPLGDAKTAQAGGSYGKMYKIYVDVNTNIQDGDKVKDVNGNWYKVIAGGIEKRDDGLIADYTGITVQKIN